ncbi:cytochrome P450 9e2-like [Chelonus insularis]|uniref:cytochrome P450 9e2-like n=1 Tax=Chelonus insularis TaxID=460826 RepID=UPI00158A16A9|nr:cytochrome P450 9e2-like [Chelonus insularis]
MDIFTILLMTLISLLLIYIIYQMTYWPRRKVPNIRPIPIIGNEFGLIIYRSTPIADYCMKIYKYHPEARYFGLMMYNMPVIHLKDPEIIKEIYIKNFDFVPDHKSFIEEEFDPIFGKNVFSLRGERWRQVRSALTPSFTAAKMKFLFKLISQTSEEFVEYLYDNPDLCETLDIKDAFTRYTNDVIATSAFGIQVNSMKDRENEFYLRGKDATNLTGTRRILKFMCGILFPRLMRALGYTFLTKKTNDFFVNLIKNTVKYRDQNEIIRPDMIHLLMQARESAGFEITITDIMAQAFIFFLAGFETSSTVMGYVAHQLAYHQDVQDRLRQEVDDLFVSNSEITYESLNDMTYMDMVLSETLRLYPPVVVLDRVCSKAFDIPSPMKNADEKTDRLRVNPGTIFWVPTFAMHRDPKYFPEPDKFDPERFSPENKEKINPYTYTPFGIGPRKCIGERFALMEIKILFVRLLRKFVIKPCDRSREKIVFHKYSLNLLPEGGVWLKFEKRKA